MIRSQELSRLIGHVDRMFISFVGDATAYHSPARNNNAPYQIAAFGVRLSEVTEGEAAKLLVNAMLRMFEALRNEGAVRLAWRNGWRMELEKIHSCEHGGDILRLSTRAALFTEDWMSVSFPPLFDTDLGSILTAEQLRDQL